MAISRRKWEIGALLAILALAAFFRFWQITEIPPGLYPDEAANGNNAVETLHTGEPKIFYPENNGREGLFINIQALSIKIFGPEPWALRIVSAFFGTLTILGIYLAAKELFYEPKPEALSTKSEANPNYQNTNGQNGVSNFKHSDLFRASDLGFRISRGELIALLSSFFLATSYWHVNFSRIGFRAIMVPFFASFAAYWLLKALYTGKISSALSGGIAAGLGLHTYIAFRFVPFLLAVPALGELALWWRGRRAQPCAPCIIALFAFAALVAAAPIGLYFANNPGDFLGRSGQVSIFSADSPLLEFAKSNALTLGMLLVWGDCNPRHNLPCKPELAPLVRILFVVGSWLALRDLFRARGRPRLAAATLLAWLAFLSLPATLTREGLPHALRAIGMVVPAVILAGFGGAWLWHHFNAWIEQNLKDPRFTERRSQISRIRSEGVILAILLLAATAFMTGREYFGRFANSTATYDAFAVDLAHQGRYLAALPAQVEKYVIVNLSGDPIRGVPAPAQTAMFLSDTFDETERAAKRVHYVTRLDEIPADLAPGAVVIPLNGHARGLIAALRERYPEIRATVPADFVIFQN